MRETLWVPVVAVLGPLIGSAVGVLLPSRESLLHRLLAFAAGTMLTLSFLELIPESLSACSPPACAAGLAVGVFGVLALHHLLPPTPPSHPGGERRTALLMVAAIMLHNLPEGIAMAAGGQSRTMLLIAVAIATHDVPEGICTAAPYLYATHHRAKAFWLSLSTCLPTLLAIGAASPAEIAISILSQVIEYKRLHGGMNRAINTSDLDLSVVEQLMQVQEPVALVTVVETKGSTPRGMGAMMYVYPDGRIVGSIGGGCSEAAILRDALDIIGTGTYKVIDIDMTGDVAESEGMVCGGIMKVLVEDIPLDVYDD